MVALLLAVLGLVFGSFGNVLIFRMPDDKTLGGRSQCPHCHRILTPIELIPLLSFFIQGRRCRGCRQFISWQYPLVESAGMLLFLGAGFLTSFSLLPALALALSLWASFVIAIIDARTQFIPDILTIVLGICAISYHLLLNDLQWTGAAVACGFFLVQWAISRGMWVGSGDILLGIALGFLVGSWQHMIILLMAAYIIGALLVSVLLGLGHLQRTQHIAFGPFLVIGAWVTVFFGDKILMTVWH